MKVGEVKLSRLSMPPLVRGLITISIPPGDDRIRVRTRIERDEVSTNLNAPSGCCKVVLQSLQELR